MSFRQELKTFIHQNLVNESEVSELGEDEPLIEHGIIDSMGLMQIIQFIEEQTGVRVPEHEVLLENFQTIGTIEQTVNRLRAKSIGTPGTNP